MRIIVVAAIFFGAALIGGGCPSQQPVPSGEINFVGQSPIAPGIYTGTRNCHDIVNGSSDDSSDSISFTIDNDGLLVLNGAAIHIGLVNTFATGAFTQSSTIKSITVTNDGFTIEWNTTWTVNGAKITGFTSETYKSLGPNTFEFDSSLYGSSSLYAFQESCSATVSR